MTEKEQESSGLVEIRQASNAEITRVRTDQAMACKAHYVCEFPSIQA